MPRNSLPRIFARTGYFRDYVLAGQWFPKLGVYEPAGHRGRAEGGWNCPSATRSRCICSVLTRKFSAFPQLGHVSGNSLLRRTVTISSALRVYRTLLASHVENLDIYAICTQYRLHGLGIACGLGLVFGPRPSGLELENGRRSALRHDEAINHSSQQG